MSDDGPQTTGAAATALQATSNAWKIHENEQGTYYHNAETGESSWEVPPEFEDASVPQFLQDMATDMTKLRATLSTEALVTNRAVPIAPIGSVLENPLSMPQSVHEACLEQDSLSIEQDIAAAGDFAWLPTEQRDRLRRAATCASAAEARVLSLLDGSERGAASKKVKKGLQAGVLLLLPSANELCKAGEQARNHVHA